MLIAPLKNVLSSAPLFHEWFASWLGLEEVIFVQYIPQYLVSCFSSIVSEPAEEQKGSYLIPA